MRVMPAMQAFGPTSPVSVELELDTLDPAQESLMPSLAPRSLISFIHQVSSTVPCQNEVPSGYRALCVMLCPSATGIQPA